MRSVLAFLTVAVAVTLTPGPAFALMLQVAARDGWTAAMANIAGNALGVLGWAALSAVGASVLLTANRVAYDSLHYGGAAYLVFLGVRAFVSAAPASTCEAVSQVARPHRSAAVALRKGAINSVANPKLAVFFISLFPAFVPARHDLFSAAMMMAGAIVVLDFLWYGSVAFLVDRFRRGIGLRLLGRLQRVTGTCLVAVGLKVATARP